MTVQEEDAARESAIELVLTDQAMPQMTGVELIAEIKNGWPKVPVILATGFAELPPAVDPLQIVLAKPFLQSDLEQAVNTAWKALERGEWLDFGQTDSTTH